MVVGIVGGERVKMAKLFVLIKRAGSKRFLGAIPARSGVSKARLSSVLRKNLKKGFSARIVTEAEFKVLVGGRRAGPGVRKRVGKVRKVRRVIRKRRKRK